jgi:hypothetical protein
MTRARRVFIVGVVMFGILVCRHIAVAQVDQAVLAQQLLGPDVEQRARAFAVARELGPAEIEDDLRVALISLLERTNEIIPKVARSKQTVDQLEDPLFIAALSRQVANLDDVRAIPALSKAVYGGITVTRALAAFGERAVPDILRVVTSTESHHTLVDHGVLALRMMAERPEYRSASSTTHQQMKAAAVQRLQRPGYFTTLWQAIDLAAVLGDSELRQMLQRLAASPDAVIATGITAEADIVQMTQKRAAERLAGVPPLPRLN